MSVNEDARGNLTRWGWGLLIGGWLVSAGIPVVGTIAYRMLCPENSSGWGANRTMLCSGEPYRVITAILAGAVAVAVIAATVGALAFGLLAWRRDRARSSRISRGEAMLLACASTYTVAYACEAWRVLSFGLDAGSSLTFAAVSAGVIFAVWMAAAGVAGIVAAAVRDGRKRPAITYRGDQP